MSGGVFQDRTRMSLPPEYPQELTEEETELGFQLLEIESLAEWQQQSIPQIAVAVILSPSSILVKGRNEYRHAIFGRDSIFKTRQGNPMWIWTPDDIHDAAQYLHEYGLGLIQPDTFPHKDFQECVFKYRRASDIEAG